MFLYLTGKREVNAEWDCRGGGGGGRGVGGGGGGKRRRQGKQSRVAREGPNVLKKVI